VPEKRTTHSGSDQALHNASDDYSRATFRVLLSPDDLARAPTPKGTPRSTRIDSG